MSANPRIEPRSESAGGAAQAFYFGPTEQHLFGWLHRPTAAMATDVGLVLCNPFGYEAICSHRSVRAFAEAAAAMGVASLRFDYRGTGDSADFDPDTDQIDAWVRDVAAAVAELRRQTGVKRVCLLGFRIGALLAALAARESDHVCGLMAIAPIVSGRRYVRELRTTRLAALLGSERQPPQKAPADGAAGGSTALEVSGYLLSSATLAALGKVDLCALDHVPAPRVLVVDSETLPAARGWADTLTKAGADVTYGASPGLVEMLMTAPQFAVVPRHLIAAMQEWLSSFVSATATTARTTFQSIASQLSSPKSAMTLPCVGAPKSAMLTERTVRFGPDAALFGIVTEPPRGERRRRAVILLNPGVDHHIGASRLYVLFARQWGSQGYVVLRMDLAGIGDSLTRAGNPDDDVFPDSALDDIRAAIKYLSDNHQIDDVSLVGLCSGAYHALRAAAAGIQVQRILMINPQNYFWKKGMSITDLQLVEVVRNPGVYQQQMLSAAAWKRLVRGEVNLFRIAQVYLQRAQMAVAYSARDWARRLRIRLSDDLCRDLEEIAARGVAIVFVFARGEPGLDLLQLEGGPAVNRLGSRCRVHVLDQGDHVFSHHDSRAALVEVLGDELLKKTMIKSA